MPGTLHHEQDVELGVMLNTEAASRYVPIAPVNARFSIRFFAYGPVYQGPLTSSGVAVFFVGTGSVGCFGCSVRSGLGGEAKTGVAHVNAIRTATNFTPPRSPESN